MKKMNRFLGIIIIIFSIVAFTPSPFDSYNHCKDQVTIFKGENLKLSLNEKSSSNIISTRLLESGSTFEINTYLEIDLAYLYDDVNHRLYGISLNERMISLDINALKPGSYTLRFGLCDSPNLATAKLIKT